MQTGRLLSDIPATDKALVTGDLPQECHVELLADCPDQVLTGNALYSGWRATVDTGALSVWCAICDAVAAVDNNEALPPLNAPATTEGILRCIGEVTASLDTV